MDLPYAQKMHIASSSLWAKALQIQSSSRMRQRSLAAVVALALLSLFWLYGPQHIDMDLSSTFVGHGHGSGASAGAKPAGALEAWRTSTTALLPPKIWQIVLSKKTVESKADLVIDATGLQETATWVAMNPGYSYTMMGEESALAYIKQHFSDDPAILPAYLNMPNVGMKSDFLRYLVLGHDGGVYTDTDTVALQPIDDWVPEPYRNRTRLVVGIEFDRRDGPGWGDILHWVQFCQWTIAAAPGHPVFRRMARRILASLDELSAAHGGVPVKAVAPSSLEVMNSTGPAAWTETVFLELMDQDPSLTNIKNLSYMTEPTLYGDVLVLPIDGFGMGQPHSNSTVGDPPPAALMRHLFRGSWRGNHLVPVTPPAEDAPEEGDKGDKGTSTETSTG